MNDRIMKDRAEGRLPSDLMAGRHPRRPILELDDPAPRWARARLRLGLQGLLLGVGISLLLWALFALVAGGGA